MGGIFRGSEIDLNRLESACPRHSKELQVGFNFGNAACPRLPRPAVGGGHAKPKEAFMAILAIPPSGFRTAAQLALENHPGPWMAHCA